MLKRKLVLNSISVKLIFKAPFSQGKFLAHANTLYETYDRKEPSSIGLRLDITV